MPDYGKVSLKKAKMLNDLLVEYAEKFAPGLMKTRIAQSEGKYYLDANDKRVYVSMQSAMLFDRSTGDLLTVGYGQLYFGQLGKDVKVNVSLEECISRAKEFYKLVGGKHELELAWKEENLGAVPHADFAFDIVVPGAKHPIGDRMQFSYCMVYGLPMTVHLPQLPEYETPSNEISEEDAKYAAIAAALTYTKWERMEAGVDKARYVIPSYSGLPNAMSEKHKRQESQKKATLVYEVSVHDSTSWDEEKKYFTRFVQVYVDAETGLAIALFPAYARVGSASAKSIDPVDVDFEWTCGKATGKLEAVKEAAPTKGKKVLLKNNKSGWLYGLYDSKKNLLTYTQGRTYVYRPDKNLSKALRAYKPAPAFNQPAMTQPKADSKQ